MISNNKKWDDKNVISVLIPEEKSWSDNIFQGLEKVKTDFVMILLEDYFITCLDLEEIQTIISTMKKEGAAYIQIGQPDRNLSTGPDHEILKNVKYKPEGEPFRASLQACIFRVSALKELLKKGENPWEFEKHGSARSSNIKGDFLTITKDAPIIYLNMGNRCIKVSEKFVK